MSRRDDEAPAGGGRETRAGGNGGTPADGSGEAPDGQHRQTRPGRSRGNQARGNDDARADGLSEPWQRQLNALGGFIRVQRRLADMSLREMASLTSVSNAYLSQIERGLHQPSLRVLRSIAQALRIAPEELLRRANFIPSRDEADAASSADAAPQAALPDTEAAIAADPRLTPGQREALLNVYRSFRDSRAAAPQSGGRPESVP